MIELLENLSNILSNNLFIAPFIALIAGVLAALLPCSLTQLPLLIYSFMIIISISRKKF